MSNKHAKQVRSAYVNSHAADVGDWLRGRLLERFDSIVKRQDLFVTLSVANTKNESGHQSGRTSSTRVQNVLVLYVNFVPGTCLRVSQR